MFFLGGLKENGNLDVFGCGGETMARNLCMVLWWFFVLLIFGGGEKETTLGRQVSGFRKMEVFILGGYIKPSMNKEG